jgi:hypothetical protein
LIADKAFDADPFIAALNDRAIVPVIPSKSNRKTPRPCDFVLYCERNLIERFFKNQGDRTRYDKLDKIFLAGVQLPCSALLSTEDRPRPRVERCMVWWVSLCIVAAWAFDDAFDGEP